MRKVIDRSGLTRGGVRALACLPLLLSLALTANADAVGNAASGAAGNTAADAAAGVAMRALRGKWEHINYEVPQARRASEFEALAAEADRTVAGHPGNADVLIWQGIIYSTWAGADGGLSALGHAKKAKAALEAAIRIEPRALEGSAFTSLGALYYQVPGWPIGFGDDDKARSLLTQALSVNPNGIDANYFWADYLHEHGDDAGARRALQRALNAPARPDRALADRGRRAEINALLAKLER